MIRVLVVDDSAIVRNVLTRELGKHPNIEVVGSAVDPYVARERIMQLRPDVLTLDVEMPRMDGLTFLEKLMSAKPMPVVVLSSLTPKNSPNTFRALELGAVEVIPKPDSAISVPEVAEHLIRAVLAAGCAKVRRYEGKPQGERAQGAKAPLQPLETTNKVVAIGASTGGTQALEALLRGLPATFPGTLIVQHMPTGFTEPFAKRLNNVCAMTVREAEDGMPLARGLALVAPAGRHLGLQRSGANYVARVKDGPPVHHVKPAVDILFDSVAKAAGANALGVILTGMGQDGARGMLAMRQAGAMTFAESEETCTVFGMPKAAIAAGGVGEVVRLDRMGAALLAALAGRGAELKAVGSGPFSR